MRGSSRAVFAKMRIGDFGNVRFQLDTGSTINIITQRFAPHHHPCNTVMVMWNGDRYRPVGETQLEVSNPRNGESHVLTFTVVPDSSRLTPVLGLTACKSMRLMTVNSENFCEVNAIKPGVKSPVLRDITRDSVVSEFADVFTDELGTLPGVVHLTLEKDAVPFVSRSRRVPVAVRDQLQRELDKMVKQGVIAVVDEPTDWVSNIVVARKKSGALRICIDPLFLNRALRREHFQLPVLEDVLPEFHQARVFTVVDLASGYLHCTLDAESSYLTTVATPFGRYRYLRLPFGLKVSSEIFQKRLLAAVGDVRGVVCIADDLVVYGVGATQEEAVRDHDCKLRSLLSRCRETGIRLNPDKLRLRQPSVVFLGHVVSQQGLNVDPDKVRAVREMPPPSDIKALQRFNGFVNYLSKFVPHLTTINEPLRRLTLKDAEFVWAEEQQHAFQQLQSLLSSAPTLRFFDNTKPVVVQSDASKYGLGAVLLQDNQPLAYASRALSSAETRYANIEKELLAAVFAVERFHQYTFGPAVTLQTDHKPLVNIVDKQLADAPRRLQSLLMRLQRYDVHLEYVPGPQLVLPDTLSRAFLTSPSTEQELEPIMAVTAFSNIKDATLERIKAAAAADPELAKLREYVTVGWPERRQDIDPVALPYVQFKDEISELEGVLCRDTRVIVPRVLRPEMVQRTHAAHLGIDSCLRLARQSIYYPGITSDIRVAVQRCSVCSTYSRKQQKETLQQHEFGDKPWQKVGVDLFTYGGHEHVVTVDYFSNFFEVDRLEKSTSREVIQKIKPHFARHGVPMTLVSDGGPCFKSGEFAKFATAWGFTHVTTSPHHARSNGKAESAVKAAKSALRKASAANTDPWLALLSIRNTPLQTLNLSPAQLMFSRVTRSTLPVLAQTLKPAAVPDDVTTRRSQQQQQQASSHDRSAKDLPKLLPGDTVRVQPEDPHHKEWRKGVVVEEVRDRTYDIDVGGKRYSRNRKFLKKTSDSGPLAPVERDDEEEARDVIRDVMRDTSRDTDDQDRHSSGQDGTVTADKTTATATADKTVTATADKTVHAPVSAKPLKSALKSDTGQKLSGYVTRSGRQVKPPVRFMQ